MNPKLWDLLFLKTISLVKTKDSYRARARIADLGISGMTCRLVAQDELEEAEERMDVYMRFVDKELYDTGIPNIYFPKQGCFDLCKKSFEPTEATRP